MDFVGIFPYLPRDADTMIALFSEVYAPEGLKWELKAVQGAGFEVTIPVNDGETDQGGFRFVLPSGFDRNQPVRYRLRALQGAYGTCSTTVFSDTTKAPLPSLTAPRLRVAPPFIPTGSGFLPKDEASAVFTFPGLRSAERVEWVLGTPREGQAWNWRSGKPVWGEIRQPDSVHVRIRHKDIGVLQEYGYLVVTSPRILTLQTADRTLGPTETVDPMTRILPKVFPEPTRGLDGTSRMELQCRFGDEGWKTCPAEGWNHGASRSGRVELRVVWTIQGRGESRIVTEPARSWIITTRTPEEQGIVKATVKLDGRRLARLLDTASGVVTALRRTNTDLPIWSATPPVVRTMEGEVLPQQTESYDPVQKTWLAWVALPALSAHRDLDLELWIGDQSPVPSPWSLPEVKPTQRLADGGNASSHLGELAMNAGIQQDWNLPSADRGWSASLWTRWNGSPQTVWRSARFTLGIDDSGSLWAILGGQSLRSAPHVLDRLGPHLLAASWNEGDLELWSNGIRVATARIDAQGDGPFTIGTSQLDAVHGLDEIRWESWRSPGAWAVRYAAERPRGDLWNMVSSAPMPSILASYTEGRYDTMTLSSNVALWQDRDQHVAEWPGSLGGGILLRGRGADAGSRSVHGGNVVVTGYAQLCGVGDGQWNPPNPWRRQATLFTTDLAAPMWCREIPPGAHGLPGSDDTLQHLGLRSWVIVAQAGRDAQSKMASTGDTLLDGSILQDLPSTGLSLVVRRADGGIPSLPGQLIVLWPKDSALPAGAVIVDSIRVRLSDGSFETRLLVRWPENLGIPSGMDVYRLPPVVVTPTLGNGSTTATNTLPITFLDGSTTTDWPWLPTVIPAIASARDITLTWGESVRLWIAVPPSVPLTAMQGWTRTDRMIRVVAQNGTTEEFWPVWTRTQAQGPMQIDLGAWFDEDQTARFLLIGEGRVKVAPDWTLERVRLRGVGGPASVLGGRHQLTNLDMQYAAALALKGSRHTMRIAGMTGFGERLSGVLQGLGPDRLVSRTSPDGKVERLVVSSTLFLHDLRADLLNTDSVLVDVSTLRARGVARLLVRQKGSAMFGGGMEAVLFRDRNADYLYTQGIDEKLGVRTIGPIASGDSLVVEFPLAEHDARFPEELYLAWIDAPSIPEVLHGDHLAVGGNPCLERKEMAWSRTVQLPGGTMALLAHLRDSDGDGRIRPSDLLDTLQVRAGQVCMSPGFEGQGAWCLPNSRVGTVSDLAVRDVNGDGAAEILAGEQILTAQGTLLLDLAATQTGFFDLDEDGRLDQFSVEGNCRKVRLADGHLAWASGCTEAGLWAGLGPIPRNADGCVDISISGLEVKESRILVRVANAGSIRLEANLPIVVKTDDGAELTRTATRDLLEPGEWEDLWVPRDSQATGYRVEVDAHALTARGLLDFDSSNNTRSWSLAPPEVTP